MNLNGLILPGVYFFKKSAVKLTNYPVLPTINLCFYLLTSSLELPVKEWSFISDKNQLSLFILTGVGLKINPVRLYQVNLQLFQNDEKSILSHPVIFADFFQQSLSAIFERYSCLFNHMRTRHRDVFYIWTQRTEDCYS